jgi:hypothetical protein
VTIRKNDGTDAKNEMETEGLSLETNRTDVTIFFTNKIIMAHPNLHAKSSAKKFGGKPEDYIHLHEWLDETKSWFGDSLHRMWRHHSEGIFEMEKRFGTEFKNSDGKTVYTRYVGEQHIKEDCNNYIPSAKEWVNNMMSNQRPQWMLKTIKLEFED